MKRAKLRAPRSRAPRTLLLTVGPLAALLALVVASQAYAGPVRGTIRLPAAGEPADGPSYYWNAWNGFLEPKERKLDPRREVSVVLTGEAAGDAAGCEYQIRGGDFAPRTIVARGGSSIRIENRDGCTHELQSDDIEGFAPIATAPGNARAFSAPAGGPHHVTDRLYGHIEGWIVGIEDLVACATIDDEGKYVFEDVAAGEYTLKIFRNGEEVTSQTVTATAGPLTLDPIALD